MRCSIAVTTACTVCVVCLRKYFLPRWSGRGCIQQICACSSVLASGEIVGSDDHVAAADVDVVLEHERDGLRAEGLLERAVVGPDFLHRAVEAAGQDHDLLADPHDAAGDLAAEAAEIVQSRGRADCSGD